MNDIKTIDTLYHEGMYEFANNNLEKSIDLLSEAARLDPDRRLIFVSRGSAFLKLDRVDEAIADFDRAVALDAGYARAFHLRGLAREKRGDTTAAIGDFTRAIELDPEYGAAYHSRATLHVKLGQEDQAVDDIAMVQHLTSKNLESFASENNVWHSRQMQVEAAMETELER